VKRHLLALRYAQGLSATIASNEELDAVAQSFQKLAENYNEHHDLRSALGNPAIQLESRANVLEELGAAGEIPKPIIRTLLIMLRRGRITLLPAVAETFAEIAAERQGRRPASVKSAAPLDDEQRATVRRGLEHFTGKVITMNCGVDPDLLGGVVARVGGVLIDGSVRTRLNNLREHLLAQEL